MKQSRLLIICLFLFFPKSYASNVSLKVGPSGYGIGHPNPITFQSPLEYKLTYLRDSGFEFNLAVVGLTVGQRYQTKWGGYTSLGGGLVTDYNGTGPGVYASFGYDPQLKFISPVVEFTQLLGISRTLLSPYSLQIGASVWF